jgi:hypothetical protein
MAVSCQPYAPAALSASKAQAGPLLSVQNLSSYVDYRNWSVQHLATTDQLPPIMGAFGILEYEEDCSN